jgi:hypothetical protein
LRAGFVNTNMHVTAKQASTLLRAVRYTLTATTDPDDKHALHGVESMLLAAQSRIVDATHKRNKTGVWA